MNLALLVSLSTLLPPLLDKITSIEKQIGDLKISFLEMKEKFTTNTNAVINYKESVDKLLNAQVDAKSVMKDLDIIKESVLKIEMVGGSAKDIKNATSKTSNKQSASKKPEKEEKDILEGIDEKTFGVIDAIISSGSERKSRLLTLIDVKRGFKADEKTAEAALKWLEKNKMYNPKTHVLTFPK